MYEDIVSGNYAPNDIITEASLIAKYKVSKSPIREALIELCKDGVLQSLPRLGYQVVPVSLKEVLDVIDFRIDVELAGLKRSFGNLDEGSLRELEKIAHIPEKELENPKWDRNLNFHTSLYELSDNQYGLLELQKVMREMNDSCPSISKAPGPAPPCTPWDSMMRLLMPFEKGT